MATCQNRKINLAQKVVKLLRLNPWIEGVALTGSVAAGDCAPADDLDFLVITKPKRVYLVRFYCYTLATILGKKHRPDRAKDSWCFNMFLADNALVLPASKQTAFSCAQLNNLLPLWQKNHIFTRFQQENQFWAAPLDHHRAPIVDHQLAVVHKQKVSLAQRFGDRLEKFARQRQQCHMSAKITREIINDQQLFFHPLDRSQPRQ